MYLEDFISLFIKDAERHIVIADITNGYISMEIIHMGLAGDILDDIMSGDDNKQRLYFVVDIEPYQKSLILAITK